MDAAESVTNPQRWNRYPYALNNPLTVIDPAGRDPVRNQLGTVADIQRILSQPGNTKLQFAWIDIKNSPVGGDPGRNPAAASRYILLRDGRVVDMQHFLAAAALAMAPSASGDPMESVGMANILGWALEVFQWARGSKSGFADEDLWSSALGSFFSVHYDREKPLGPQIARFLGLQGAISKEEFNQGIRRFTSRGPRQQSGS